MSEFERGLTELLVLVGLLFLLGYKAKGTGSSAPAKSESHG